MNIEVKEPQSKITKAQDVAKIFQSILYAENEIDQDKEHWR